MPDKNRGKQAADLRKVELTVKELREQLDSVSSIVEHFRAVMSDHGLPDDQVVEIDGARKFPRAMLDLNTYTENVLVGLAKARLKVMRQGDC